MTFLAFSAIDQRENYIYNNLFMMHGCIKNTNSTIIDIANAVYITVCMLLKIDIVNAVILKYAWFYK